MTGDRGRYRAFISYSWKDKDWGERLHRWLEKYRTPKDQNAATGDSRRLGKFFRDDSDMPAGADIGVIVRDALARSDNLIVICSPQAATSQWVRAEIEEFQRVSPAGQIFAVIVDGAPNAADPAEECFPPQLRKASPGSASDAMPIEPVGVDLRRDGRDRTCARLAAGLLRVDFDDLWQRDRRRAEVRQRNRMATLGVLSLTFAALLVAALVNARNAHLALSRFFAERAWQRLDSGDTLTAARYALAGARLAPQNIPLYEAALGATMHAAGESLPALLHADSITSAAFCPDGTHVITGGRDRAARVWRVRDGKLLATLPAGVVRTVAFSPDHRRAAVADETGVITVWDIDAQSRVATLRGHENAVVSAAFLPGGRRLLSLGEDHTLRIWTVEAQTSTALGDGVRIWAAELSPDGRIIAAAREDGVVVLYDVARATVSARLRGHRSDVYAAAFSPDGGRLVTAGADSSAIVWNVRTGRRIATLRGHALEIFDVAFSPDGTRIVTAGVDQTAKLWNARTGALRATLAGHASHVTHAIFSHDGTRIATAGQDGAARIWNARDGSPVAVLRGHAGAIVAIALSPDDGTLLTAGNDGRAKIWSLRRSGLAARLQARGRSVFSVEFTADSRTLIAADDSGAVQSWSTLDWTPGPRLMAQFGDVYAAIPSPDGALILTAGAAGVRLLDRAGRLVRAFDEAPAMVAAFSRDGARIVTAGDGAEAVVWNAANGLRLAKLAGHKDLVRSASFSPDGRLIATGSEDATVRLWDSATGAIVATLEEHRLGVGGVVFGPDGATLLTTSDDGTAVLWDVQSRRVRVKLIGHRGAVYSGAFSPDGRRIATASEDGSARVWDSRDGRALARFEGARAAVFGVAFSPDAARLAMVGEEDLVRVWNVGRLTQTWDALAADACTRLLGPPGRRFSRTEIQSDPLLGAEWPRPSRDVCEGVRGVSPTKGHGAAPGAPAG